MPEQTPDPTTPNEPAPDFFDGPGGRLAYRRRKGGGPVVVWLGGFRSDMEGTKALHLDAWAAARGRAFLRFDYRGHGRSDGRFEDGTIGAWRDDAAALIAAKTSGPLVLVGSSMGGWIAGLLARDMPERLAGLVLIAPAPDFTERLMWPSFTDAERDALLRDGRLLRPSAYCDAPEILTLALFEDGRRNGLLEEGLTLDAPVRILQGMADADVPWRHAMAFAERIACPDLEVVLTKSGDHRLSSPRDLDRLTATLDALPA